MQRKKRKVLITFRDNSRTEGYSTREYFARRVANECGDKGTKSKKKEMEEVNMRGKLKVRVTMKMAGEDEQCVQQGERIASVRDENEEVVAC